MRERLAFYGGLIVILISVCIITILIYADLGDSSLIQVIRGLVLGLVVGYTSAGLAKWVYNKLKESHDR